MAVKLFLNSNVYSTKLYVPALVREVLSLRQAAHCFFYTIIVYLQRVGRGFISVHRGLSLRDLQGKGRETDSQQFFTKRK